MRITINLSKKNSFGIDAIFKGQRNFVEYEAIQLGWWTGQNVVYRNTWLGNYNLLIIYLIVNITLNNLRKALHNLFTITADRQRVAL